jgi:hypothetical protein
MLRATIAVVYDSKMVELAGQLPSALRARTRFERLGDARVPALLVHPDWDAAVKAPLVIWMHGRTVSKELDPGRYMRWMRAGIGACAVDLPGHGERFDATLHKRARAWDVIRQMVDEIDPVVEALGAMQLFDMSRIAIGGMSGGGMAAMARLCRPHPFTCASVEASSGSWGHQREGTMFRDVPPDEFAALNPIDNLGAWREIAFQAIHARGDEWMHYEGQLAFIEELRRHYDDPELVQLVTFDETGAQHEHIGFGRRTIEAKTVQLEFLRQWLAPVTR